MHATVATPGYKVAGGRGRRKLSLTGHTVKFAAAVGGSMAANRDINQAARWHLWRVTRLVLSEPHLTVEHEEQPPPSPSWTEEERNRAGPGSVEANTSPVRDYTLAAHSAVTQLHSTL